MSYSNTNMDNLSKRKSNVLDTNINNLVEIFEETIASYKKSRVNICDRSTETTPEECKDCKKLRDTLKIERQLSVIQLDTQSKELSKVIDAKQKEFAEKLEMSKIAKEKEKIIEEMIKIGQKKENKIEELSKDVLKYQKIIGEMSTNIEILQNQNQELCEEYEQREKDFENIKYELNRKIEKKEKYLNYLRQEQIKKHQAYKKITNAITDFDKTEDFFPTINENNNFEFEFIGEGQNKTDDSISSLSNEKIKTKNISCLISDINEESDSDFEIIGEQSNNTEDTISNISNEKIKKHNNIECPASNINDDLALFNQKISHNTERTFDKIIGRKKFSLAAFSKKGSDFNFLKAPRMEFYKNIQTTRSKRLALDTGLRQQVYDSELQHTSQMEEPFDPPLEVMVIKMNQEELLQNPDDSVFTNYQIASFCGKGGGGNKECYNFWVWLHHSPCCPVCGKIFPKYCDQYTIKDHLQDVKHYLVRKDGETANVEIIVSFTIFK